MSRHLGSDNGDGFEARGALYNVSLEMDENGSVLLQKVDSCSGSCEICFLTST